MSPPDLSIRLARTIGCHPALHRIGSLLEMRISGGYAEGAVASFDGGRFAARRFDCYDDMVLAALRQPRWHERTPSVSARVDTSSTWTSLVLTVACAGVASSFAVDCFASGFEGEDAAELDRWLWSLHRAAGEPWESHGK